MSIAGYRVLTDQEIDLINRLKAHGQTTQNEVDLVRELMAEYPDSQRWAAIASTHFQQGYMALIRSIARPETFA